MDLTTWGLLTLVSTFVGSGGGAYIEAYLKKKGENLATHEDVSKLVAQFSAVTQAAKDIEASISSDIRNRQRRWELKRDTLLVGKIQIAALDVALTNYKTFIETEKANRRPDEPELTKKCNYGQTVR